MTIVSRDGCAASWWATKSERLSSRAGPRSRHDVRCLADEDASTLVRRAEMTTSTACRLRAIAATEVLAPAVSGNANADLDFIETGMDAQEPASPAGKEGTEFTNRHVRVP